MFKNMGQEAFDFRAKFQDTYQRAKIEEKGSWDTRSCKIHLEPHVCPRFLSTYTYSYQLAFLNPAERCQHRGEDSQTSHLICIPNE